MLFLAGSLLSGLGDKAAYLDPGSGSFLLQLLIAGLAGLGIFVGSQWAKIKRRFGIKPKLKKDEDEQIESLDTEKIVVPSDMLIVVKSDKSSVKLPAKCPSCGAPVRSKQIKWLDEDTAECAHCGVTIEGKVK